MIWACKPPKRAKVSCDQEGAMEYRILNGLPL